MVNAIGLSRAGIVSLGIVIACAAIETSALLDRSRGEPRNRDIRRYVLGEIFDDHRVEQRFAVRANGLSSVTIHPRPASPSPTGAVVLQLRDITDDNELGVVVQRISIPLPALAQSESFTMRFPRQASAYRDYALDVRVEGGSDGQGIGLLASRGQGYPSGLLLIDDGRPRWGDLIFETTVDEASSNFGAIAAQLEKGGMPAARFVLLWVIVAKYLALFAIIRACARPAGEAALAVQSRPSLQA